MEYLQLNAIEFFNLFPSIAKWVLIAFSVIIISILFYFLFGDSTKLTSESIYDEDELITDK